MNYTTLVNKIKQYFIKDDVDFVSNIPDFINQGLINIYNDAEDIGFEETVTDNFIENDNLIAKPVNWQKTISFSYAKEDLKDENAESTTTYLLPRSLEFCRSYSPLEYYINYPKFYSDFNYSSFYISPTPDSYYRYELRYLKIPLFNANNPENFLTRRYPNLLLYACLIEAAIFLDNQPRKAELENSYNKMLIQISKLARDRMKDRTETLQVDNGT